MAHRILIVEDDRVTRLGVQELLETAGYDVLAAQDFLHGRRLLEDEAPDLLIVDLRLGGYNGLQLLHVNPRPVPAIVVTGFPDAVLEADARRLGAEFVVKPIAPAALLAMIDRLLHTRARTERRLARRLVVTGDIPAEVNAVPARLVDISATGLRIEIPRLAGIDVPSRLTVTLPVQHVELDAELVWSAETSGRWLAGAEIIAVRGDWEQLVRAAE